MARSYVNELDRKHKYSTRACAYFIKRITEPTDLVPKEYRSIRQMAEELKLSDPAIRKFVKSGDDSMYIRSKQTGILYLLTKPIKDCACSARLADYSVDAPDTQTFTSIYQLVKRFRLSPATVYKIKESTPLGQESEETVYDEFKRKYYLTFYK